MRCVECGGVIATPTADPFRCLKCREGYREFITEMVARRDNHATWNRNLNDFMNAYWMATRASGSDADELDREQRTIWDFAQRVGWPDTLRALADAMDSRS